MKFSLFLPALFLLAASCSMQPTPASLSGSWIQPVPGQPGHIQGMQLLPDGRAEVRGHPGMAVEPLRLLPLAAGEALFTELGALAEDLTGRYGSDTEWLDKVYHVAPYLWRAQSLGQAGHARERAREKEDA